MSSTHGKAALLHFRQFLAHHAKGHLRSVVLSRALAAFGHLLALLRAFEAGAMAGKLCMSVLYLQCSCAVPEVYTGKPTLGHTGATQECMAVGR